MTLVFRQKSTGMTHLSLGSHLTAALVRCRKRRAHKHRSGAPEGGHKTERLLRAAMMFG
jgi:hypothetical protein